MIFAYILAGKLLVLPAVIVVAVLIIFVRWKRSTMMLSPQKIDSDLPRHARPCLLLMGPTNSGKTSLMNDLCRALRAGDRTWVEEMNAEVARWQFESAEVLEVAGSLFATSINGNGHDKEWKNLIRLLQRHRPQRPVDGIVLALPAPQLAGTGAFSTEELRQQAEQGSKQLQLLREQIGFSLPIYVVITQCNTISGYRTFLKAQLMAYRDEMFGWSNPYNLEAPFDPQWTTQAFLEIDRVLSRQRANFFVRRNGTAALKESAFQDELFLFPVHLRELQITLTKYLERFFHGVGHRDGLQFRGIYFAGDIKQANDDSRDIRSENESINGASFTRDLFEHKIFPEHGLAHPIQAAFTHRHSEAAFSRALCGVAALLLFPGAILSWRSLSKCAKTTAPYLQQVDADLRQAKPGAHAASAYGAIYAAQSLSGRNFQSVFLPASMIDSLNPEVEEIMPPVFNQLVYPGLFAELEHRTSDLLQNPAQPIPALNAAISTSGAQRNAQQRLNDFTDTLLNLEDNIVLYNNIAPAGHGRGKDLMTLATFLSPETFADLAGRNSAALNDILRNSSGVSFDGHRWNQPGIAKLEALVTDVLRQSLNEEQLLTSLDSVVNGINLMEQDKVDTYDQLNGLFQSLNHVQSYVSAPDLQWIAGNEDQPQLPSALDQTLNRIFSRPIQKDILLCDVAHDGDSCPGLQQLKTDIEQMALEHLMDMRKKLLSYQTKTTGPLLATADAKLQLSQATTDLQTVLTNFLKLPFVAHEGTGQLRDIEGGQQLFWDNDRLQAALQDKQAYDKFFGSELANTSPNLEDTFEEVALVRLEANMMDSVASAQQFQPLPAGDQTDQATMNEIRAFQAASHSLGQVLERFSELNLDDDYQDLLLVSTNHALMMLARLDRSFEAKHFYWPAKGNFDAWTGTSLPSVASYGAHNAEDMGGYLASQRQEVQQYASAAQPLVAFLEENALKNQKQAPLIAKWQSIVSDLAKYDPTNAASGLVSVEDFLTNGMDRVTPPDCQLPTATAASRLVYFVQVRHSLEHALSTRCHSLRNQSAFQQYNQIANFFNQRLAGKFPFASPASDPTVAEADPADIVELYRQLDSNAKSIHQSLQTSSSGTKATVFLNQLDALRPMFTSLIAGEAGAPFSLDVAPIFRVNRNHETNGNQIIDWSLQVGNNTVRNSDPPSTIRWNFGEPIKLVLRWAKDSPQQPLAVAPAVAVTGTRTILFYYQDSWSLLRMLTQHEAAAGDFDRSVDPDPQTLVFTAGQENVLASGKGQSVQTPQTEPQTNQNAKVFVRIRIYAPGKTEALRILVFPAQAPTL